MTKIAQAEERFARMPYARKLGIKIEELAEERAVLRLPHDPEHANVNKALNGGATASLLNMAGALAAWTGLDLDVDPTLRTVDMTIQYLSAAVEEDVLAAARVLRRGRDLFFLDVALYTPEDKPICQGLMIYRGPDYSGQKPRITANFTPRQAPAEARPWTNPKWFKGFGEKLRIEPTAMCPGYARLEMGCPESNTDKPGQMHEGAAAAIADFAGTLSAWSVLKDWKGVRAGTIGMQLGFARPAEGPVVAASFLEQRSEETFLSSVAVTEAGSGQLICKGQVSYRLLEPR